MVLMINGKKVLGYALGDNVFMTDSRMDFSKIFTSSRCYSMNQNTDGSFTCDNNISDYSGDWIIMSFMYSVLNFYSVITTAPFKMNNRIVQEVETDSGGTATIDCTSTYNNNFSFSNSPVYNSDNPKAQLIITRLTIKNGEGNQPSNPHYSSSVVTFQKGSGCMSLMAGNKKYQATLQATMCLNKVLQEKRSKLTELLPKVLDHNSTSGDKDCYVYIEPRAVDFI